MEVRTDNLLGEIGNTLPKFRNYKDIVTRHGYEFEESQVWLTIGKDKSPDGYIFFLSVRLLDITEVLELILPVVSGFPDLIVRIAKSELEASKVSNGYYGHHLDGKMIQLQPSSESQARELAPKLADLTRGFKGMILTDCVRLGDVLYVRHIDVPALASVKKLSRMPEYRLFNPSSKLNRLPRKKIIATWFLPVEVIKHSNKGNVYKGVNLLNMSWCIIKQGNSHAVDDIHGRDMRDRINWQRSVVDLLHDKVRTPRFLGYAEYADFNFLITEYLEGKNLQDTIVEMLAGKTWRDIGPNAKIQLLRYFRHILDIVGLIHQKGLVHRDLTPSNFMLDEKDNLFIIDFEMAYSFEHLFPDPPFVTGTLGYICSGQVACELPMVSHDIYSLGAIFLFMVTGKHPRTIKETSEVNAIKQLYEEEGLPLATAHEMSRCLSQDNDERPTMESLAREINHMLYQLLFKSKGENEQYNEKS
jgi:hypothetical protein